MTHVPRLYPIVDASFFHTTAEMIAFSEELAAGGCTLLQYRNKSGNARVMLEQARELGGIALRVGLVNGRFALNFRSEMQPVVPEGRLHVEHTL